MCGHFEAPVWGLAAKPYGGLKQTPSHRRASVLRVLAVIAPPKLTISELINIVGFGNQGRSTAPSIACQLHADWLGSGMVGHSDPALRRPELIDLLAQWPELVQQLREMLIDLDHFAHSVSQTTL
jgi:hypothetical protein